MNELPQSPRCVRDGSSLSQTRNIEKSGHRLDAELVSFRFCGMPTAATAAKASAPTSPSANRVARGSR